MYFSHLGNNLNYNAVQEEYIGSEFSLSDAQVESIWQDNFASFARIKKEWNEMFDIKQNTQCRRHRLGTKL